MLYPHHGRAAFTSFFPAPSLRNPLDDVNQSQQHRYFDQRTHGGSKCLVTERAVHGDSDSNSELEIVARGREALGRAQPVPEAGAARGPQGEEEDDDEVQYEGHGDAHDGDDLVDDLAALVREQHDDGVQQADEGPRRRELEEHVLVPLRAREPAQPEARDEGGAEGDPEEDGHARRDDFVGHVQGAGLPADDADEEDGEGREEHDLEDRVDGYEDRTVFPIAAGEFIPN